MKRTLGIWLALVMLLSIAPMAALAEAAQTPIRVVMLDPLFGDASSDEGYKMVHDAILEATGVDVVSYRFDSASKTEKVNLLLMSSDVKVNMWCANWSTYQSFGMIRPITDYLDLIPSVIKTHNDYNPAVMGAMTDSEGNVWGIPRVAARSFNQTFIRQDWLDQLGLEYPTTFDEFEACLYAIKEADPYGNGETIPLLTRNNMTYLEYHFLAGFTPYGRCMWLDEDGLLKPYYLQEGYYDFLEKMIQWRKDGLFHPENITWNTDTLRNYFASGRVGASAAYATELTAQYVSTKANYPGAKWYFCEEGMTGPNGNKMETLINGDDQAMLFNINNTDEEMRACLKVFEWGHSDWNNNKTLNSGIQGIHWEYDTRFENCYEDHITRDLEVDPSISYKGEFWYTIGVLEQSCMIYDADGERNFHNEMISHQRDFDATTVPFDLNVIYNSQELNDNVMEASDINTMVSRETMAFFTGDRELTPENWQAFIDSLYATNLQGYIEEYTRQYNEWKGIEQ